MYVVATITWLLAKIDMIIQKARKKAYKYFVLRSKRCIPGISFEQRKFLTMYRSTRLNTFVKINSMH